MNFIFYPSLTIYSQGWPTVISAIEYACLEFKIFTTAAIIIYACKINKKTIMKTCCNYVIGTQWQPGTFKRPGKRFKYWTLNEFFNI